MHSEEEKKEIVKYTLFGHLDETEEEVVQEELPYQTLNEDMRSFTGRRSLFCLKM